MSGQQTLAVIVLVFIALVIGFFVLFPPSGTENTNQPLATPTTESAEENRFIDPETSQTSAQGFVSGYVDVTYDPYFPEMLIPISGSIQCSFTNGDIVTLLHRGDSLHITGTKSHEDFLVTAENVALVDFNSDGWVKITDAGDISVMYDPQVNQWKTDWLRGCPQSIRTPAP
jgi:hypothetical protein